MRPILQEWGPRRRVPARRALTGCRMRLRQELEPEEVAGTGRVPQRPARGTLHPGRGQERDGFPERRRDPLGALREKDARMEILSAL